MNVSDSSRGGRAAAPVLSPSVPLSLHDIAPQLRAMLDDADWQLACQNPSHLQALLQRIDAEPGFGSHAPPADVAILVAAHQDFCRFRRAMAARLSAPNDPPMHITPDEWLQLRLRHRTDSGTRPPYAEYRPREDRFHIVD